MNSNSISIHRIPMRKRSMLKKSKKPAASAYIPTTPIPSLPRSSSSISHIKKPMRPLTAYHIFFQIEREYIIQNTAGPDADKSIHDNKSFLRDVPRRYRCIKLLPDWYAGPGKRRKRKHRKSHGKIGFLELSRVISKRWATLGTSDPETKKYVTIIAAREMDEYKLEMKQYKELTENMIPSSNTPAADVSAAATDGVGAMVSPAGSPKFHPMEVSSSTLPSMMPYLHQSVQYMTTESTQMEVLEQDFAASVSSSCEDEIDYSICSVSNNGHYIPSPGPALSSNGRNMIHPDGTICDPLFELENEYSFQQSMEKRCVSPVEVNVDNVDIIDDGGLFRLMPC